MTKSLPILLALSILMLPTFAQADCYINAEISAEFSGNSLGAYTYTLDFTWDMDTEYGLSHFNLLVDAPGGTCACYDFSSAISFAEIAGYSDGEDGCMVNYAASLECDGDPSIPNLDGIIFKFEPFSGDCEPGNMGSGSITFYSDLAPVPVNEQILAMSDKGAHVYCDGTISGVFPGMACEPVATEQMAWDAVKSNYR